ncbi:MAG: hypothetical protein ACYCSS_10870 [Sulfuriferula sp.]
MTRETEQQSPAINLFCAVLRVVILVCPSLTGTSANAQKLWETCAGTEVQLIHISIEPEREVILEGASEKPVTMLVSAPPSPTPQHTSEKTITIVALDPILGSMDSRKLETRFTCTQRGVVLTAIITRSADYHDAVQKNVLWRPQLQIVIIPGQPEVIFETIWKMRLTTGAELNHTRMPPYPEQNYPITVMTTVR